MTLSQDYSELGGSHSHFSAKHWRALGMRVLLLSQVDDEEHSVVTLARMTDLQASCCEVPAPSVPPNHLHPAGPASCFPVSTFQSSPESEGAGWSHLSKGWISLQWFISQTK